MNALPSECIVIPQGAEKLLMASGTPEKLEANASDNERNEPSRNENVKGQVIKRQLGEQTDQQGNNEKSAEPNAEEPPATPSVIDSRGRKI